MQKKKSEKAETYTHDVNKPLYEFKPGLTGHEWKQQGPYLICHSCELKHATHIGINKLMMGIDEKGKPILKKR